MSFARTALTSLAVVLMFAGLNLADEKKKPAKKSGTLTGAVTAKGKNYIEVKADGEENARRYMPRWIGNASGWRRTNVAWRPSMLDILPSLSLSGEDLSNNE